MSALTTLADRMQPRRRTAKQPALLPLPRTIAKIAYMTLISAFLLAPIVVVLAASLTERAYLTFPPHGVSLKWYRDAFAQQDFVDSLKFSVWTAAVVATLAALIAYLLALALGSTSILGHRRALTRLVTWLRVGTLSARTIRLTAIMPMMLPVIVLAVALLQFFARIGIVSSPLSIIFGQLVMCLPFAVLMAEIGLGHVDPSTCLAAESLGASKLRVLRTIVVPASSSGLAVAWAFSFVVAFGDSTVALLLQGPGQITAPIDIFNVLYFNPFAPTVAAMAGLLAVITFACLTVGIAVLERGGRRA
ncbi:ABC transporter permease [Nocardioides cheoyonin]|uniref:ABC transporter permease n=1 Tax=Nocardioides cheoyonin TaxID=3156615 RepID=UPI0032B38456